MDYYSTLGLNRGASAEEIKKAYKRMAMKHHPDRGGDEKKFKEVEEAYRTLSDPQKKQMFDMGIDPNRGQKFGQGSPFEFHFGTGNMEDLFANFGFGMRPGKGNKNLSIKVDITLEDVAKGKTINAEIGVRNGKSKLINIEVPPGIEHGQQIRYEGMGDDTITSFRPGDLIVNINVLPHPIFRREGTNLIIEKKISVWDAILGYNLKTETIDHDRHLDIYIPPGTQPETLFSCKGEGLPHMRTRIYGNLILKVKIEIPKNLTAIQIDKINDIKNHGL